MHRKEWLNYFSPKKLNRTIIKKYKAVLLAFSFLPLMSSAYLPQGVSSLVPNVNSKTLNVTIGSEQYSFSTQKEILKDALIERDLEFNDEDIIEPSLETALLDSVINVNIKKAIPVIIVDNGEYSIGKSVNLSVTEILKDLSIKTYEEDTIKVADPLEEMVLGLKIYIERATLINLQIDGQLREVHTKLETVSDLLEKENIVLSPKDRVEPSMDTQLTNDLSIKIVRVLENENSEILDIPFPVQYKDDNNLYKGEKRIQTQGTIGKKEILYKRIIENGVEIRKEVIEEKVLKEPVAQIVLKGTKSKPSVASGSFSDMINDAAAKYGVDAAKMYRMMICESGGNPNAVGGGGRFFGLFQYLPSTWAGASAGAGFKGASIFDARAQIYTTAWKISIQGYGAWPVCGKR